MPGQFIDAPEPPKTTGQFIDTPPPPSQGGFRTLPGSTFPTRQIDLGNGKTSEQRQDGLVWFGPAQGNTGKPGWFNAQGLRGGANPGEPTSLMDSFANELVTERNKRAALPLLGQLVPGQISGMAKGLVNNIVGPAQLAAHALGSSAVDPVAQGIEETYRKNWQQSPTGEMVGQAIPFLMTGGASGSAQTPGMLSSLANIGKAGVTGAAFAPALTPETNLQGSPDFWARKRQEALLGGVLGAVPAVVSEAGVPILNKIAAMGKTKAPGEVLEELSSKLGGKSPGEALQTAAQDKYNQAWDEFKTAVAPVDAEAGGTSVDYAPAVDKLQEVLGVGQKRAPLAMPDERRKVLQGLLSDLQEANNPEGNIDNSFAGAIDVVKRLGAEQRRLAVNHGDIDAREMLGEVRDSILQSMQQSSPSLSQKAQEARQVFAQKVVPLFDKSQGGQYLTQIRDTPTPGDLLASGNQGTLARMKPERAAIVAKGSSADPLLYSYLDAAINQSKGNPRAFADSITKAMPAIEAISDPATLKTFQGMVKVAKTARWSGMLANMGLAAVPGYHEAGAGLGMIATMNPSITGPGLIWKLMQNPNTRNLLSMASKLPEGSPEINAISERLSKLTPAIIGGVKQPPPAMVPAFVQMPQNPTEANMESR